MLWLGYVNEPVTEIEKDIECYKNEIRKEAKEFDKIYGNVEKDDAEWIVTYEELKRSEEAWLVMIKEEEMFIKWIKKVGPRKRKQIENEFTLLKDQESTHYDKRREIQRKLKRLEEQMNDESIQIRN